MAATLEQLKQHLPSNDELWGIDLETRGLRAECDEIQGIGFANSVGCFYVDIPSLDTAATDYLKDWLRQARLTAFNVNFDAAFLQQWVGQWLNWEGCSYGLFKALTTEGYPGQSWSLEIAQLYYLGWPTTNKADMDYALKEARLSKGDMWKLSPEILGSYCASDADAALQLWNELEQECISRPALQFVLPFHQREFLTTVKLLVEQQLRGTYIDQEKLKSCHQQLLSDIDNALDAFLTIPEVANHIAEYNAKVLDAWRRSAPPQLTAKGAVSKRYEAWEARGERVIQDRGFNPNSKDQLADLFYGTLGYKVKKRTKTNKPCVDKKVLPTLGEAGKALNKYNLLVKRRGYVERLLEKTASDGLLHSQFNSFGTVSGRLGGSGGFNLQQIYKDRAFLESFRPKPGNLLVQLDFAAIEPTLLAEFSQDATMLRLYGAGANPNHDLYLFNGAQMSLFSSKIGPYYDIDNPIAERISECKKLHKDLRDILKLEHLSWQYGAGPRKQHEMLQEKGYSITLREVEQMSREKRQLYRGVAAFQDYLQDMWRVNGWVPNVTGRPICVHYQLVKDLTNRVIQSSAHDVLQMFHYHIDRLRTERNLDWKSWVIDFHDEAIVECPADQAEAVAQSFVDALAAVNAELDMGVQVKGAPEIADNLADIKLS